MGAIQHPALKYSALKKIYFIVITNLRSRDSCRDLLKMMKILTLCSQYIYVIIHSEQQTSTHNEYGIHNFNTRYNTNLHPPISNFTKFHKRAYYSGIKIFSHLPTGIKCLTNNLERLCIDLKMFLKSNSFYTLEEFFNDNR